jgi:hypothetical protein
VAATAACTTAACTIDSTVGESSSGWSGTSPAEGRPDCSFKGGTPGFVRVTAPAELAFPDYDGNGTFRSLGNPWSIQMSACCAIGCKTFADDDGAVERLRYPVFVIGWARIQRLSTV